MSRRFWLGGLVGFVAAFAMGELPNAAVLVDHPKFGRMGTLERVDVANCPPEIDNNQAGEAKKNRSKRGDHHPIGPVRHSPLGLQVAFLAFCFLGGIVLGAYGFKRAGDTLDDALETGWKWGFCVFWWGCSFGGLVLAAWSIAYGLSLWA